MKKTIQPLEQEEPKNNTRSLTDAFGEMLNDMKKYQTTKKQNNK
jgi:hypothetical protein